jgi:L-amino acid N-acyltransferase YncA
VAGRSAARCDIQLRAGTQRRTRRNYAGIGEFSVYVRRDYRGRGAGRAVLAALIEAATAAGLHKLTSRVFPEKRGQPRPSERRQF